MATPRSDVGRSAAASSRHLRLLRLLVGCVVALPLVSCLGIPERDIPVYKREAALVSLARGDSPASSDLLYQSLDALDPGGAMSTPDSWNRSVAEWTKASFTDARSFSYRPDDYELILMLTMRFVAEICRSGENFGDLYQVQERQEDILRGYDAYDLPEEQKITEANYELVSFPHYLYAAIEESNPRGGRDRARKAYEDIVRIQESQGAECPLAAAMVERLATGGQQFTEDGAVHVVGFLGRGAKKVEKTDVLTPILTQMISIILSAWGVKEWGGTDFAAVPLPYPDLVARPRLVRGFTVETPDGSRYASSLITDVTGVARSQFEARKPWILAQAVIPRLFKTTTLTTGEAVVQRNLDKTEWKVLAGIAFFLAKLFWERSERADTRCWTLLPDTIHSTRIDLPEGKHRLKLSALTATGATPAHEVEIDVRKGRNTFIFVFYPNPASPPAVVQGKKAI